MESFYLVKDSLKDLAAIRGIAGPAIRAAEVLGVDGELREGWRDLLEHLAPYPVGAEPESKALTFGTLADGVWAAGHLGDIDVPGEDFPSEDVWAHPVETFEAWTLESGGDGQKEMVRMLDLCPNHRKAMTGRHWRPSLVRTPIAFPLAGRGEELPALLAAHYSMYRPHLANGLSCFEQGIQSMGLEPSGMAAGTLQQGLMQSVSPAARGAGGHPGVSGLAAGMGGLVPAAGAGRLPGDLGDPPGGSGARRDRVPARGGVPPAQSLGRALHSDQVGGRGRGVRS